MPKKPKPRPDHPPHGLPSAAELAAFLANSPGKAGKRDVARAFGVTGKDKITLKAMLKDIGHKASPSQQSVSSVLPAVLEVEITALDAHGDPIASPVIWNEGRLGARPQLAYVGNGKRAPGIGDRVLARIEGYVGDGPYTHQARFMRALGEDAQRIVGIFRKSSSGGRIVPSGKKERDDYVVHRGDEGDAKDGELVQAELVKHRGRGLPQARIRQRLGASDDPRNTSLIAIFNHGIPDVFPPVVEQAAQKLKPFLLQGRDDVRAIPFITIDPADARDHDDAIWAEPDSDAANPGGFRVHVAIADVAAYVQPGSPLDQEARRRGNSTYFPDRVVPMLPERISNDLCSLKEGEDRPALVCAMVFDAKGHKRNHRFTRAVIRVAFGLAYEKAQAIIDGKAKHEDALRVLQPLWAAYGVLSVARDARGPLDLDLPERRVLLDEAGNVSRIVVPERLTAHRLVEEFMIQANVAAAEALIQKRSPLLFRVHEEPSTEKLRGLQEFLKASNIPFSLGQVVRSHHFNRILAAAKGTPQERVVHEVVLRSQAQAVYSPQNAGHFGLSLANYAHFTSPIRRYADLVVHRSLISAFKLGMDGLHAEDIAELEDTATHISATERRSMLAERETIDRMVAAYLAEQLGAHFAGRISGVVSAGLFVVLQETGADGFVPASSLGKDYFALDPVRHALVGAATGETFQLGDQVTVRLMEVAPVRGGLRLEITSDGKKGAPMKHIARGDKRQARRKGQR